MSNNSFKDDINVTQETDMPLFENEAVSKSNAIVIFLSFIIPFILLVSLFLWFFVPRSTADMREVADIVRTEIDPDDWEVTQTETLAYVPLCGFPTKRCPSIYEVLRFKGDDKYAYENYLQMTHRIKEKGYAPIEADDDIESFLEIFNKIDKKTEIGESDPSLFIEERAGSPLKDIRETISDDYRFFITTDKEWFVGFYYSGVWHKEDAKITISIYGADD